MTESACAARRRAASSEADLRAAAAAGFDRAGANPAEITESAINYSRNLPNFLCLAGDSPLRGSRLPGQVFALLDTIAERLTYFEQKEDYKVISKNGIPRPA